MRNFQGIVFIQTRAYREIFKSALVYIRSRTWRERNAFIFPPFSWVNHTTAWNLHDVVNGIIWKFPATGFQLYQKHLNPSITQSWNWRLSDILMICWSRTKIIFHLENFIENRWSCKCFICLTKLTFLVF